MRWLQNVPYALSQGNQQVVVAENLEASISEINQSKSRRVKTEASADFFIPFNLIF